MYIGINKIEAKFEDKDDLVKVGFKGDHPEVLIHKELLEKIETKEKGQGSIVDTINHYFATKFLAELSYYNLDFYNAANIGQAVGTLAHNLREDLFRRTFSCNGANDIGLKLLLNDAPLDSDK